MSLIVPSAYLNMCECGQHGRFIMANGTAGENFSSKEKAREELNKLYNDNLISAFEHKFLNSQISDAPKLAATEVHANILTRLVCEIANTFPECKQTKTAREYVM